MYSYGWGYVSLCCPIISSPNFRTNSWLVSKMINMWRKNNTHVLELTNGNHTLGKTDTCCVSQPMQIIRGRSMTQWWIKTKAKCPVMLCPLRPCTSQNSLYQFCPECSFNIFPLASLCNFAIHFISPGRFLRHAFAFLGTFTDSWLVCPHLLAKCFVLSSSYRRRSSSLEVLKGGPGQHFWFIIDLYT